MEKITTTVAPKIYRVADISARYGISKSYIYHLSKNGLFPKSFSIIPGGTAKGWVADEVDEWFYQRMNQA